MSSDSPLAQDLSCLNLMNKVRKIRLRKTLYYGRFPRTESLSLPITELAVDFANDVANECIEHLDMTAAAKLSRQACLGPNVFVIAMVYLQRLRLKSPDYLSRVSPHDLFLISMMVASKFLYDEGTTDEVWTDEWAECGNIELDELAEMEVDFCANSDWRLFVGPDEFESSLQRLECRVALKMSISRGFFTYGDLSSILSHLTYQYWLGQLNMALTEYLQALAACTALYLSTLSLAFLSAFSCAALASYSRNVNAPKVTTGLGESRCATQAVDSTRPSSMLREQLLPGLDLSEVEDDPETQPNLSTDDYSFKIVSRLSSRGVSFSAFAKNKHFGFGDEVMGGKHFDDRLNFYVQHTRPQKHHLRSRRICNNSKLFQNWDALRQCVRSDIFTHSKGGWHPAASSLFLGPLITV